MAAVVRNITMVGEVIVYLRDLSDAELAAAESYLATKWGLP